jgi:hypothetical protein
MRPGVRWRTDQPDRRAETRLMQTDFMRPRIIESEVLFGGLVITFEDGRGAFYSASLLGSMFVDAQEIADEDD